MLSGRLLTHRASSRNVAYIMIDRDDLFTRDAIAKTAAPAMKNRFPKVPI